MRIHDFEIKFVDVARSGSAFANVQDSGQWFVVSEPGVMFNIEVQCLRLPYGFIEGKSEIRACLDAQGSSVGYSEVIRKAITRVTFDGFAVNDTKMSFKFAPSTSDSESERALESKDLAQLGVFSFRFLLGHRKKLKKPKARLPDSQRSSQRGSESDFKPTVFPNAGKKFWQSGGLGISMGTATPMEPIPTRESTHKFVIDRELCSLNVKCDTAACLELRKVISRSNPAHARIFEAEAKARQVTKESKHNSAGMQEEVHVKPEHASGGSGSSSAGAGAGGEEGVEGKVIDLVRQEELSRKRKALELELSCDVTAEDDNGQPVEQWTERKRPRVDTSQAIDLDAD